MITGLNSRVKLISLAKKTGWRQKIKAVRNEFSQAGGRKSVFAISFCFSADAVNFFMRKRAMTFCCPRGNLFQNYRFDYGLAGLLIARLHYLLMKNYDTVISMSDSMTDQLKSLGIQRLKTIGNFVDEVHLEPYRRNRKPLTDKIRFAFLGSLTERKRPGLMIVSFNKLIRDGYDCHLDIIGQGNLRDEIVQIVRDYNIDKQVTFYGHLPEPYDIIQEADFMLLPSESEGVSRAVMEALFFGVPCILRDVDANREIIEDGDNGYLFKADDDLTSVMKKAALTVINRSPYHRRNLLPLLFRQNHNIEKYLALINSPL